MISRAASLMLWLLPAACSPELPPGPLREAAPPPPEDAAEAPVPEVDPSSAPALGGAFVDAVPIAPPSAAAPAPCPRGMILVDGTACSQVERTCLDEEKDRTNHIRICHAFAHVTKCVGTEEKRRFCIDEYEYPNEKGAHPPWLVSWYDGEAACQAEGKRLCYESEWVTACEGPERTPFPYGWERDPTACNIDNVYIGPDIDKMYTSDQSVADGELRRIDQSVPSGSLPGCVSGYGVRDLTGNFDEWVTRDAPPESKSKWAGLKGGAWGHVRNACRPVTTSHPPQFTYYFISFRCCRDADGSAPYQPRAGEPKPAVPPRKAPRLPKASGGPPPNLRKVRRSKRGGV